MASQDGRILCVGSLCLDIINICERYPKEDEDIRAKDQKWQKGGNATNTCHVLRMLNRECELLTTMGRGVEADFVVGEMKRLGILHSHCEVHPQSKLPTSCVVLSTSSASRTIVHYRDLPDLQHEDFLRLDLSVYKWIHFEGRNTTEVVKMISTIRTYNLLAREGGRPEITVSVELEKSRPGIAQFYSLPDVLFISKEYVFTEYIGYHTAQEVVVRFKEMAKEGAVVICAWGERGAAAADSSGQIHTSPSFPPPTLIDTLGAGDTFNAGVIHMLSQGATVGDAITFACHLAGVKCGIQGFDDLKDLPWLGDVP